MQICLQLSKIGVVEDCPGQFQLIEFLSDIVSALSGSQSFNFLPLEINKDVFLLAFFNSVVDDFRGIGGGLKQNTWMRPNKISYVFILFNNLFRSEVIMISR